MNVARLLSVHPNTKRRYLARLEVCRTEEGSGKKKEKKKKRKKKKEEQEEETSLKHPSLSSIIGEIRSSARAGTDCATKPANVRPANERNGLINLNDSLSLRYECIRNP